MALFVATPLLAILVVAVRILYFEPNEERKEWNRRETPVLVPDAGAVPVTDAGAVPATDAVPPHTPPGPQQA
ncbi:MAG TPA: hypothetical protein VE871_07670, partial [Longimicrobium sp.]|nr:hypothetical protein [Longimicrobium sp.]